MNDINVQSPDPAERDWEYDNDGTRIYKPEAGYGCKTPYKLPPSLNTKQGTIYF